MFNHQNANKCMHHCWWNKKKALEATVLTESEDKRLATRNVHVHICAKIETR